MPKADLRRPWVLFVGPPKTGTSWVDRVLRDVDGVCLPQKVKETFFFTKNFSKGTHWYFEQFLCQPSDGLCVEVGPTYFFGKCVPERIREAIPEAQIVISLRDPVRRAVSQYLHLRKYGRTDLDIARALERFPSIALQSIYATRMQQWFDAFGRSSVQVIFYEEVIGDVPKFCEEVLAKFGLQPSKERLDALEVGRIGAAAIPRSKLLGKLGQQVARRLRVAGLHSVIEVGKQLGIKGVLFSGGAMPDQSELGSALLSWEPKFAEDREALTQLLGRDPPWRVE